MTAPAPSRIETPRRALGILAVSYTTIAWGLAPLMVKEVDLPTLALATWRRWFGGVINIGALYETGRRPRW